MLRSENPVLSEIEKLIPDNDVICQTGKPHALSRMAHAFLVGDHGECHGECPLRLERHWWPPGQLKQLINGSAGGLTERKRLRPSQQSAAVLSTLNFTIRRHPPRAP